MTNPGIATEDVRETFADGGLPTFVEEAFGRGAIAAGWLTPGTTLIESYKADGTHWFTTDLTLIADIEDVVYFVGGDIGAIKIGFSSNLPARLKTIQAHSPITVRVLATVPGSRDDENLYHARFADARLHGEWFSRTDALLAEVERLQGDVA